MMHSYVLGAMGCALRACACMRLYATANLLRQGMQKGNYVMDHVLGWMRRPERELPAAPLP